VFQGVEMGEDEAAARKVSALCNKILDSLRNNFVEEFARNSKRPDGRDVFVMDNENEMPTAEQVIGQGFDWSGVGLINHRRRRSNSLVRFSKKKYLPTLLCSVSKLGMYVYRAFKINYCPKTRYC
jgi:hypothetical protein